jgi:hypothetical protein
MRKVIRTAITITVMAIGALVGTTAAAGTASAIVFYP